MEWQLFFTLLAGHYLADYALQTEFMATRKADALKNAVGFHALTAHAAIQGLVAGLLSQNFTVGAIVALTHWLIDLGKASKGLYGINIDQTLHILVLLAVVLWVV